jgi:hypothetical protein
MIFKFECPTCNHRISAPREDAGVIRNCPSCAAQFTIPTPPPEARLVVDTLTEVTGPKAPPTPKIVTEPLTPSVVSHFARNTRALALVVILGLGFGFIHVVQTDDFFTIIPKASFTFSDTFLSVSEIIDRSNNQSLRDAFRGDPQLDNLVSELKRRGYLSSRKRTWSELEDSVKDSLPDR